MISRYRITWECCTPGCQESTETIETCRELPRVGDVKKLSRCVCLSAWHKITGVDLQEAAP